MRWFWRAQNFIVYDKKFLWKNIIWIMDSKLLSSWVWSDITMSSIYLNGLPSSCESYALWSCIFNRYPLAVKILKTTTFFLFCVPQTPQLISQNRKAKFYDICIILNFKLFVKFKKYWRRRQKMDFATQGPIKDRVCTVIFSS